MHITEPILRKVILKSDNNKHPLDPTRFHLVDAATGKQIDHVKGLTLKVSAEDCPSLTVETFPVDFDIDDIPIDAIFEPTTGYVDDAKKQRWINGRWLAELFRKNGTKCMMGENLGFALDITEDLLKEWEGLKTGPNGGQQNKENTSHGKH